MTTLAASLIACAGVEADDPNSDIEQQQQPIINGTLDTTHQAVVFLYLVDDLQNPTQAGGCTGTIIKTDPQLGLGWVLTAAHCVDDLYVAAVVQGDDIESPRSLVYNVLDTAEHPQWRSQGFDLGIVRIGGVSADTPTMAITGASDGLRANDTVTTIGYGQTETPQIENTKRRKTNVRISEVRTREIRYPYEGTGSCHGDSGGPSIVVRNGVETVVGVVAHGLTQADCYGAGADMRVSAGLDFIQAQLNDTTGMDGSCGVCQDSAYSGSQLCARYMQECTDDVDCGALVACFNRCNSSACYANCRDRNIAGVGLYLKVASCGCNEACADRCANDASCADSPKCGLEFAPGSCTSCVESKCCDELYEASTDKKGYECLVTDGASGCGSNAPMNALSSCISNKCASECADDSPIGNSSGGNGGSSGSGSGTGDEDEEEPGDEGGSGGGKKKGSSDEGGCNAAGGSPASAGLLGLLALLGVRRRHKDRR